MPTMMVLMTVPLEALISLTVPSPAFATQTWVPSEETPTGSEPTLIVRMTLPLETSISLTVSSPAFATQTWVPSENRSVGPAPTLIVLMTSAAAEETLTQPKLTNNAITHATTVGTGDRLVRASSKAATALRVHFRATARPLALPMSKLTQNYAVLTN